MDSFFLDPEDIKSLSLMAIWSLGKGIGSLDLVLDYGPQRARLKAEVHRDRNGTNPFTI
jgi:hypothetical protein